jgi:dienelactone hydrolase
MNAFSFRKCRLAMLVAALTMMNGANALAANARFEFTPAAVLVPDAPLRIVLEGLAPKAEVTVRAERVIVAGLLGGKRLRFRSEAAYLSDGQGRLDLATTAPVRGSYSGAQLQGLFWSMKPTDDVLQPQDKTGTVRLQATAGGQIVAEASLALPTASASKVIVEKVEAFPGAVFAKPSGAAGKLPVLILLGGGEGGSGAVREHAPKLAAQGFAVLGLPFYSPADQPGGPRELPALPADFVNIDVLQLNAVRDWLGRRDEVDARRIGLYGASKGAEFALLAASHLKWVKAVVAVTPSDVVWEGYGWDAQPGKSSSFALGGKALDFVPYQGFIEEYMRFGTGEPVHLRRPHDQGRAAHPKAVARARIPVERYKGALLLLAGQDDQMWNSSAMAHNIAERRAEQGLATELLIYSDAGHYLIGDGWSPTTHYNAGLKQSGGTPAGTAQAQIDARPKILAFLRRAL